MAIRGAVRPLPRSSHEHHRHQRLQQIGGQGGIWVHALEALNNQKGCLIFADGHAELHAASDLITEGEQWSAETQSIR